MISWLSGLLRSLLDNSESERVQLNRDARVVIEQAEASYGRQTLRDIAQSIAGELQTALAAGRDDETLFRFQIDRIRALHRTARRENQQVGLTAHTLSIIYLRSLRHTDGTTDARQRIDEFVTRWRDAEPGEEATLPG